MYYGTLRWKQVHLNLLFVLTKPDDDNILAETSSGD